MRIRAGLMDARLTVTRDTIVERPDGGQDVVSEPVVVGVAAALAPLSSDEALRLGALYATATHRARLRTPRDDAGAVIDLTPAMRASATHGYTGQVREFAIVSVTDVDGRGAAVDLVLEERVT